MTRERELRLWPLVMVLMLAFGVAACGGESGGDADTGEMSAETAEHDGDERAVETSGEESGEHSEEGDGEGGRESEGEHGGEGREGPESGQGEEGGEGEHRGEGREGEGEHGGEGREGEGGEHGGEGGHDEGGEEGEEPGIYIERSATWDMERRGARLVLSYDAAQDAFVGRVENTTTATLCAVRVEVHVGGGPELGPTARTDVPAGGAVEIVLPAEGASIDTWTAHPELSGCGEA